MGMVTKLYKLKELKLEVAEREKSIAEIEDMVKAEMTERNVTEMVVDIFKVRWTPYSSTRVDTAALKAELPEIAARYSKTTEGRRFSVV